MIQSLENLVSMAIQGTQVPMYTKHTLFLYFFDFSIFLYEKQNKQKLKINKQKHVINAMQKLDWLKIKAKHTSNATNKNKKIEESDLIT